MSLPVHQSTETVSTLQSWTPTLECTDSGFHFAYVSHTGGYVRQGSIVIAQFSVTVSISVVGSGGQLTIGALPYSATDVGGGSIATCTADNLPSGACGFAAFASGSDVILSVLTAGGGSISSGGLSSSNTTTNGLTIYGSVTYFTSDPA